MEDDDLIWLVLDIDRWKKKSLSKIARECNQKSYNLAISNPSFELWLLLHIKDINEYSLEEQNELVSNKRDNTTRTSSLSIML